MKKILGKKDKSTVSNLILYIVISIIGIFLLNFPAVGVFEPVYYMSAIFYIIAFISVLSYFIARKEGDYENLLFGLILVLVGSYLFLFKYENKGFILGTAIVILTLGILLNKGYRIYSLSEEKDSMWFIKFVVTFILGFLGVLVTINLYKEITLHIMMFGYYFLTFGIINLLDPIFELLLKNESFNSYMSNMLEDNDGKQKIETFEKVTDEIKPIKKVVKRNYKKTPVKKIVKTTSKKSEKIKAEKKTMKSNMKNKTIKK